MDLRIYLPNLKFVALSVPEIMGGTQTIWAVPKFSHVSLGVGGWPLGYEERRWWAKCPCN